ncbi:MAG: hypothetical protein ACE5F1_04415 [Planctomycetota bacterium]
MRALFWVVLACVPLPLVSIRGQARQDDRDRRFFDYWHQGEAEISRYRLSQARYGENHDGHAVLIFVTEDFLPGRGVKYEGSDPSRAGSVPVLKLNFVKKFITGIYPYSMMCSVFTPTNARRTRSLKVSASIQEWCGHVYQQMNLRDGKYRVDLHSYFEQEADRAHELEAVMLEDEIWTRIRLHDALSASARIGREGPSQARHQRERVTLLASLPRARPQPDDHVRQGLPPRDPRLGGNRRGRRQEVRDQRRADSPDEDRLLDQEQEAAPASPEGAGPVMQGGCV